MNKKINISKSAIGLYLKCPYAFYLNKVLNLKTKSFPAMNSGRLLHDKFNKYFDVIRSDYLEEDLKKKPLNTGMTAYEQGQYENFLKFNNRKYKALKNKKDFMPMFKEIGITIPYNKRLDLKGFIDRVDKFDNQIIVMDYKTGRTRNDISSYLMELSFYENLLNKKYKIFGTHWGIYFSYYDDFAITPALPNHYETAIVPIIDEIDKNIQDNNFKPSYDCKWCLMKEHCSKVKK